MTTAQIWTVKKAGGFWGPYDHSFSEILDLAKIEDDDENLGPLLPMCRKIMFERETTCGNVNCENPVKNAYIVVIAQEIGKPSLFTRNPARSDLFVINAGHCREPDCRKATKKRLHALIRTFSERMGAEIKRLPDAKTCSICDKLVAQVQYCSGCRKMAYCSRDCQKLDWPTHKATCERIDKKDS